MMGPMLQALLEDRFKLRIRRENREVPVYALTLAKGGPKLPAFQEGSCTPVDFPRVPQPRPEDGCMVLIRQGTGSTLALQAPGTSLDGFTKLLYLAVDRPVIDKTGIQGLFDFHLEFAQQEATPAFRPGGEPLPRPAEPADEPAAPSIFTAIQQLGLKLEPAKGPREFLVVDRVERPTGN